MISRTLSMVSIFQNSYQSAMVWIETLNERYFLNKSLIWFRIPTLYRIFEKTWQSVWILKQSKCISNTSDSSSLCSSTSPLHNHHEKNENSSAKIINYNIWLTVTSHTVRLMHLANLQITKGQYSLQREINGKKITYNSNSAIITTAA